MPKQSQWEDKARNFLIDQGYQIVRSAGSFGVWDLIAWKDGKIKFIQVKLQQGPRSGERQKIENVPPFCCPNCDQQISTKEIWLYKKINKTRAELKIKVID